jgi:hypothetical protein
MNKYLFLLISIICFAAGLASSGSIATGLGKALGGVFFIIFYIMLLFQKQPKDETSHR